MTNLHPKESITSETVGFVGNVISATCLKHKFIFGGWYHGGSFAVDGFQGMTLLGRENCNLDYPGLSKDVHFHTQIKMRVDVLDDVVRLLITPDHLRSTRGFSLNLSDLQGSLEDRREHWQEVVESAIVKTMENADKELERFRKKK